MTTYTELLAAIDRLNALDDDNAAIFRNMLCSIDTRDYTLFPDLDINDPSYELTIDPADILADLNALLDYCRREHDEIARHTLSMIALDHSLCPMHLIDYAICFDDDEPDCAAIRACFPRHDT